jgi:hypothetical protein
MAECSVIRAHQDSSAFVHLASQAEPHVNNANRKEGRRAQTRHSNAASHVIALHCSGARPKKVALILILGCCCALTGANYVLIHGKLARTFSLAQSASRRSVNLPTVPRALRTKRLLL